MALLFKGTAVFGLEDVKPVRLTIEDFRNNELLWLTDIKGSTKPNFQLMYSVGKDTFINAFNQRLSVFQISGVHILNNCDGAFNSSGEPPFLSFYKANNIIARTESLKISFENIVVSGFMIELEISSYSQEGIDGHRFTLTFLGSISGLQQDASSGSGGVGAARFSIPGSGAARFSTPGTSAQFSAPRTGLSGTGTTGSPASGASVFDRARDLGQRIAATQETLNMSSISESFRISI
jgi:hypothetical protein